MKVGPSPSLLALKVERHDRVKSSNETASWSVFFKNGFCTVKTVSGDIAGERAPLT